MNPRFSFVHVNVGFRLACICRRTTKSQVAMGDVMCSFEVLLHQKNESIERLKAALATQSAHALQVRVKKDEEILRFVRELARVHRRADEVGVEFKKVVIQNRELRVEADRLRASLVEANVLVKDLHAALGARGRMGVLPPPQSTPSLAAMSAPPAQPSPSPCSELFQTRQQARFHALPPARTFGAARDSRAPVRKPVGLGLNLRQLSLSGPPLRKRIGEDEVAIAAQVPLPSSSSDDGDASDHGEMEARGDDGEAGADDEADDATVGSSAPIACSSPPSLLHHPIAATSQLAPLPARGSAAGASSGLRRPTTWTMILDAVADVCPPSSSPRRDGDKACVGSAVGQEATAEETRRSRSLASSPASVWARSAASPAAMSPAASSPAAMSPAAINPAAINPAASSPAASSPAAINPAASSPATAAAPSPEPLMKSPDCWDDGWEHGWEEPHDEPLSSHAHEGPNAAAASLPPPTFDEADYETSSEGEDVDEQESISESISEAPASSAEVSAEVSAALTALNGRSGRRRCSMSGPLARPSYKDSVQRVLATAPRGAGKQTLRSISLYDD